ncbi:MAG: YhcH/YjgK/YiaL family protein, partial [Endomicrobiales bacterium]
MILDSIANAAKYYALHPGFKEAFEFLKKNDVSRLGYGRHAIRGDAV